jgi:microsomal dipeptidase-like Zn-dependent dipeptidase
MKKKKKKKMMMMMMMTNTQAFSGKLNKIEKYHAIGINFWPSSGTTS